MKPFLHVLLLLGSLLPFILFNCDNPQSDVPIIITVSSDATVFVRDTLMVHMESNVTEGELTWFILFDRDWRIDSIQTSTYPVVWDFRDTGEHRFVVYARASDGRVSNRDTLKCHVISSVPQIAVAGDSVSYVNDTTTIHVTAADADGTVSHLVWSVGNTPPRMMPADTIIRIRWNVGDTGTQQISMYVLDDDGQKSLTDSLRVIVKSGMPEIEKVTGDTLVSINDTVEFTCTATDGNGSVVGFQWIMTSDTLDRIVDGGTKFRWVWHYPDTGVHVVRVRVVDDDGLATLYDSMTLRVTADIPVLEQTSFPVAIAGATVCYRVTAHDDDGKITSVKWTFQTAHGAMEKITVDTAVEFSWSSTDIGTRIVTVVATDDDAQQSTALVCTVLVAAALLPIGDTTIAADDTLHFERLPFDRAHSVALWFLDTNGGAWDDSGTTASYEISYTGRSPVTVITGAQYGASAMYRDTFTITFNRAPELGAFRLAENDTMWTSKHAVPGTLALPLFITDADNDALNVRVVWGRGEKHDTIACSDTVHLPLDSTGIYNWAVLVTDAFGNRFERSGTIAVGTEHTICFAGHSIAVGYGDTSYSGGFRPLVLSALRDSSRQFERIRPVGPFVTDQIRMDSKDDSCFAVSGSFAREMLLLMDNVYTGLTADIWVLMLGVNGSFSSIETEATIDLMNRMVTRNRDARLYVLTSQPFSGVREVQRDYYNSHVRWAVDELKSNGFAAYIVETGDSTLYDENTGAFNDTLAYEPDSPVHPNTLGYHRIGDAVVKVMFEREPRVLDLKSEGE